MYIPPNVDHTYKCDCPCGKEVRTKTPDPPKEWFLLTKVGNHERGSKHLSSILCVEQYAKNVIESKEPETIHNIIPKEEP